MKTKRMTAGSFEVISLPQLGIYNVVAKVDTGAYSGAMHCTDIKVVRRGPERIRVLKFIPAGLPELATETSDFLQTYVRSSTGHRVKRFLIRTAIVIQGKTFPIDIGLSDRSDMRTQVLLGRRFLREQHMLVDVSLNQEYDDEGESTR